MASIKKVSDDIRSILEPWLSTKVDSIELEQKIVEIINIVSQQSYEIADNSRKLYVPTVSISDKTIVNCFSCGSLFIINDSKDSIGTLEHMCDKCLNPSED